MHSKLRFKRKPGGLSPDFNIPWKYNGAKESYGRCFVEPVQAKVDCADVISFTKKWDFSFIAAEAQYPFRQNLCPMMDHIIILCEPIHRLRKRAIDEFGYGSTINEKLAAYFDTDDIDNAYIYHRNFDSPYVRHILGCDAWTLPIGSISEAHFEQAVEKLEKYTLVVPSSSLGDPRLVQWLFKKYCAVNNLCDLYNESQPISMPHENSASRRLARKFCNKHVGFEDCADRIYSNRTMSAIREHNKWDVALYEYAKQQWEEGITRALRDIGYSSNTSRDDKWALNPVEKSVKDWCPTVKCWDTFGCSPCARRFLFVFASGRSGSTSMMGALNMLPGIRISGENSNILNKIRHVTNEARKFAKDTPTNGPFKHNVISKNAFACAGQKYIEALSPPSHSDQIRYEQDLHTIIGFKEVRWPRIKQDHTWIPFMNENFPCSRYIVNYRSDINSQAVSGFRQKEGEPPFVKTVLKREIEDLKEIALQFGKNKAMLMDMNQWTEDGGKRLTEMAQWLGFEGCDFSNVDIPHANAQGEYTDSMTGVENRFGKECQYRGNSEYTNV